MQKIGLALLFMLLAVSVAAQRIPQAGEVVINEFVAAPRTTQAEEWVELYNTAGESLTIGGMKIDDIAGGGGSPKTIPAGTIINAGSFYVMGFGSFLNNSGDDVRLLAADGTTVYDTYTYTGAQYDKSFARMPDGGSWSSSQYEPTPRTSNSPTSAGTWTAGNLEIHVLNVGQGMAQLVIGPTGRTMLMDCSELNWNTDATAIFVAGEIRRITGGSHLNYILVSHLHLDHMGYIGYGGIWSLVEEQGITVDKLIDRDAGTWIDYNNNGTPDYDTEIVFYNAGTTSGTAERWIAWVTDPASSVYYKREKADLGSTTQIDLGPGTTTTIVQTDGEGVYMADGLTPLTGDHAADSLPPSENDYSITVWINWNQFDYIFGGDTDGEYTTSSFGYAYNDVETVVAGRIDQAVEVISVNHHGSGHSSNENYVDTLDPRVAIYNVGANSYGHPEQRVLDIFHTNGTDQYLTAQGDPARNYHDAVIAGGNVVVKVSDGIHYTVNGNAYLAENPAGGGEPRLPLAGEVLVNEVLPAPSTQYTSEFVELYNTTGDSLLIGGMYIDDIAGGGGAPKLIPAGTIIPPHGYYLLDGFNSYFNNSGDDVRLLDSSQSVVFDSQSYSSSAYDLSRGRVTDGGTWSSSHLTPTPGSAN